MNVNTPLVCSACGKQFDIFDTKNNINIHQNIGYGSIYDGMHLDIDLCCGCLDRMIKLISIDLPLSHRLVYSQATATEKEKII